MRLNFFFKKTRVFTVNLKDGTTLVSGLQALLVQEEFYSIKQCTVVRLFAVSLSLVSNTICKDKQKSEYYSKHTVAFLIQ